jgi:hypothetical protein
MVWISQMAGAYALTLMSSLALHPDETVRHAASGPSDDPRDAPELPTLWAGHQVTFGKRDVPFKGEVETRMDSFVLARLDRRGDIIELEQTACHVRFAKVAGVMVHMNVQALPRTRMVFAAAATAEDLTGRSVVAWGSEDLDEDGHPGVTVHVQAPVCSGELYVSNRSKTKATATLEPERLQGRASVHVEQRILGAEGACLSAVAKDTDEHQRGPFAYVPVPEGTTCETLLSQGWPVTAA